RNVTGVQTCALPISGKFMLTVFGAVAELEREYILQRQREGIEIAKQQGKYTGRQPVVHPDFDKVTAQWKRGELTAVQAMKRLGKIGRASCREREVVY